MGLRTPAAPAASTEMLRTLKMSGPPTAMRLLRSSSRSMLSTILCIQKEQHSGGMAFAEKGILAVSIIRKTVKKRGREGLIRMQGLRRDRHAERKQPSAASMLPV